MNRLITEFLAIIRHDVYHCSQQPMGKNQALTQHVGTFDFILDKTAVTDCPEQYCISPWSHPFLALVPE